MKHVDEFRDPALVEKLVERIRRTATRCWTIMEVCGGQTHGLLKHGIDQALKGKIELLHGPGCPVCVTSIEAIEAALEMASQSDHVLASFGDMLRVPGRRESLLNAQARGANVRVVYSPLDAVRLAQRDPERTYVFLAVGFETTAPATAVAVLQAERWNLSNFKLLSAHVRVEPAMWQIASSRDCQVDGFLAAGHVCTITGMKSYEALSQSYGLPIVVTGFEPVDLLQGIAECVRQLESDEHHVVNQYERTAPDEGNLTAQSILDEVFEVVDQEWRGLGIVSRGGLQLRSKYQRFDARIDRQESNHAGNLTCVLPMIQETTQCRSGEVLTGRIKPNQCPQFGKTCHPEMPLGAPMVSSEGACAAYFRYANVAEILGQ
jgi:hydrogenase expression/formation protein HypD